MSKKWWPVFYSKLLCEIDQDFSDIDKERKTEIEVINKLLYNYLFIIYLVQFILQTDRWPVIKERSKLKYQENIGGLIYVVLEF